MFSSASSSLLQPPPLELRRHPNLNPRPNPILQSEFAALSPTLSSSKSPKSSKTLSLCLNPNPSGTLITSAASPPTPSSPSPGPPPSTSPSASPTSPSSKIPKSPLSTPQILTLSPNPPPPSSSPSSTATSSPPSPASAPSPPSAFAGSLRHLPPNDKIRSLLNDRFVDGDLFFDLNGVGAPDVAVVYVPAGARVWESPVHLKFCYDDGSEVGEGRLPVSNPRVLVVAERGAELAIVEEHLGVNGCEERCYWANAVVEVVVEEGAKVSHTYLQGQSVNSAHIKWTFTREEASSSYELIEISTGGKLSRHNLHIQQLGPDTVTELSAFHVAQSNQIQDLHSRLVLDHPRGYSRQLHKCIVSHSTGHAVFDGNVKVNRLAQQTDAGQLTRSLLLAPRATVNVKPNLQIVADDVKCSHGAAISDLEEDQLFYFQARGIDLQTARDALVYSFGAEVFDRIPFESVRKSVSSRVREVLAQR